MSSRLLKNFLLGLVGAVIIAVGISLFTAVTATPRLSYTVTGLGTLDDYPYTFPYRLNHLGQVADWSRINFDFRFP
jgi:multidrug efflux pump subunit AcrB